MKRLNVISLRMVRESTYRFETNKIRCPNDAYKLVTEYLEMSIANIACFYASVPETP